jgi:hypothetical protein
VFQLVRLWPPAGAGETWVVSDEAGECEARACAGPLSSPAGPLGLLLRPLDLLSEAEAPVLLGVVQFGPTMSTGEIFVQ